MRTRILAALTATLIFSGSTFAQEALIGDVNDIQYGGISISNNDCGCEKSNIVPVVYQESMIENSLEGAMIEADATTVEPMADSASVVDSPIVDSAPAYEGEMIVEGTPMAEGEMIVEGTPMAEGEMIVEGAIVNEGAPIATSSCGCQSTATPVAIESTPVFTSAAAVATPCCEPARRGFFGRLFGR